MADASILPTYLPSKFTREYVTVALGGDGGTNCSQGIRPISLIDLLDIINDILGAFSPLVVRLANSLPVSDDNISFDFKVKKFLSGIPYPDAIRNSIWLGSFRSEKTRRYCRRDQIRFTPSRVVEEIRHTERISCHDHSQSSIFRPETISPGIHPGQGRSSEYGMFPGG